MHFPEDRNVPKRQDVGEPPLVRLVKDKDIVQQPKRLPKLLRIRSAITNGAKSTNRPYAFPMNESAAKEVRRRFIRQLVP